jgi:hypothetical protein
MNAGHVAGSGATQAYYQNLNTKRTGGTEAASRAASAAGDQYTAAGSGASSGVYSKDSATMQRLWNMAEAQHASLRRMVESIIGGGVGGADSPNGQAFWAMAANGDNGDFRVDEATQARAQELIGEDGYFGIRRTTERIMEFAKALGGEGASEETIENLRKGVQQGFDYVAGLFGGFDKLPELTRDTYDSIMKEFDNWIAGSKVG